MSNLTNSQEQEFLNSTLKEILESCDTTPVDQYDSFSDSTNFSNANTPSKNIEEKDNISKETDDNQDENQDDIQYEENIESNSDSDINTENEALAVTTALFKTIKRKFTEKTKSIILKAANQAGVKLFEPAVRDSSTCIDFIDIKMLKKKVLSLNNTTNIYSIIQVPNKTDLDILDNCKEVHQKIQKFNTTKAASQVAMFASLLKIHDLILLGNRSSEIKEFNLKLAANLDCKSSSSFSKYKRKCKRVHQLSEIVGNGGASLLCFYTKIHTLENASDAEWNLILNKLEDSTEYRAFSMTIIQDEHGILPIFRPTN
ncbi:hypothetical protein INT46_008030 [Mucor plumbeus]|uniref:Uncharacterized protein n=1 Tax=Mucor plumbeus TaxID=97098 RepID=A0A8H7QE62_9FUNG|nr:hypothetical protein INT46_008030 [Mucor plumbeus]